MTEQIEQNDTLELIQPTLNNEPITTKKALLKKIRELKEQFKEHQSNKIVEIPITDVEPILKRSIIGRPKKADADKKHLDPNYFNAYYHSHLKVEVQCDVCGCYISKGNLTRHKKSPFCKSHISC